MIERTTSTSAREEHDIELPDEMSDIFAQLDPRHVEQFYNNYQVWIKQRRLALVQLQIAALKEAIADNTELMQQIHPSAIALSALSQLQACGVDDVDLLDRMLARGDVWLDQTMELLEQCERMGFINDGYTLWCENALDGAFDWLISMNEATNVDSMVTTPSPHIAPIPVPSPSQTEVTEDLLLQKLMSEEEEETKRRPAITQPLAPLEADFFNSLPVVPLPAQIEDFFSSLPVVPLSRRPLATPEIHDEDEAIAPEQFSIQDTPAQEQPSQELLIIASLHATPRPAQAPVPPVTPAPMQETPATQEEIIPESEQELASSSLPIDEPVTTLTAEPAHEDNAVTESIPRISIGTRARTEQQAEERTTGATEKVLVAEAASTAANSGSSFWKWQQAPHDAISAVQTQTDMPAHQPQEIGSVTAKPRRKIGFFRRLLNWLLGRTPDY